MARTRQRVLVIDDSEIDRQAVRRYLATASIEVLEAATAKEGVALFEQKHSDCILLDYRLPDADGLELIEQLTKSDTAILFMTGQGSEWIAAQAMKRGAADYLPKDGLTQDILRRAIAHAIEKKELERRLQQKQQLLRESEQRFRCTFEQAAVGMAHVDLDGRFLRVNQKLCEFLGYTREELLQRDIREFAHPEDRCAGVAALDHLITGESSIFSVEKRYLHKSGQTVWGLTTVSLVRDEEGEPLYFVPVFQDIGARKEFEEKLRRNALYDALTNLPNRALLMECLGQALERHKRNPDYHFAVLFMDLDFFKKVNDSLGHLVGDQLLIKIAKRLSHMLRSNDLIARLGGDEFAIFLDSIEEASIAEKVARRLCQGIEKPFRLQGQEFFISTSIGIVVGSHNYNNPEEILRDADAAMYKAKEQGKAQCVLFNKQLHQRALHQFRLEADLRRAIERDELEVHYQPIITLNGESISGFEALVRWRHHKRGLIPPGEFIPLAEDTGLIVALDLFVLDKACHQTHKWRQQGNDVTISVNLSTRQFLQPDLPQQVAVILESTGLEPNALKLEITESAMMKDLDLATHLLLQLKELGVQLYLDDFGTGYSSLGYLRHFSVDALKIDRSFISTMQADSDSEEIVRTIVALAHNLGMFVVAEGIETAAQLECLQKLHCEFGQGYFFAKPIDATAATKMLAAARS